MNTAYAAITYRNGNYIVAAKSKDWSQIRRRPGARFFYDGPNVPAVGEVITVEQLQASEEIEV